MATILNIATLLAAVKTRLLELLTGQTFIVKGSGVRRAMAVYLYRLPNAVMADASEDACPWGVVVQLGGNDSLTSGQTRVRLIFAIYNEGEDGQGDADVEALAAAVLRLSEGQRFYPHVLQPEIRFFFGHPESGAQSHPEYYLTVDLSFTREPVYLND